MMGSEIHPVQYFFRLHEIDTASRFHFCMFVHMQAPGIYLSLYDNDIIVGCFEN